MSDIEDHEQLRAVVSAEVRRMFEAFVDNEQPMSVFDLQKVKLLGEELRAAHKFEKSLDASDELAGMSDADLIKALKATSGTKR